MKFRLSQLLILIALVAVWTAGARYFAVKDYARWEQKSIQNTWLDSWATGYVMAFFAACGAIVGIVALCGAAYGIDQFFRTMYAEPAPTLIDESKKEE